MTQEEHRVDLCVDALNSALAGGLRPPLWCCALTRPPACPHSAAYNEQRRRRQFTMLAPLAYAPLLPLIRIGLRHNPPVRDVVFGSSVLLALAHAGWIMSQDSSM